MAVALTSAISAFALYISWAELGVADSSTASTSNQSAGCNSPHVPACFGSLDLRNQPGRNLEPGQQLGDERNDVVGRSGSWKQLW